MSILFSTDILLYQICTTYLDVPTILKLARTCKSFHTLIRQNSHLWRQKVGEEFPICKNTKMNARESYIFIRDYFIESSSWNPLKCHDEILIEDATTISNKHEHGGWNTCVLGTKPLTYGIWSFTFSVIHVQSAMIGVQATHIFRKDWKRWIGDGSIGITSTRDTVAYYNSVLGEPSYKNGDKIEMIVDASEKRVTYYLNGKIQEKEKNAVWTVEQPMDVVVYFCGEPNKIRLDSRKRLA